MADVGQNTTTETGPWRRAKCYALGWEAFGRCIDHLIASVVESGERFDSILGIARGGLIPAASIANRLEIRSFHAYSVRRNQGQGEYLEKGEPMVDWASPIESLRGSAVLIVDDVSGTGATLELVRSRCVAAGAAAVRVAVPVVMAGAKWAPDHVAHVLDDWVIFPWENTPSNRALVHL